MDNLVAATMSAWRDEIAGELVAAEAELTSASAALADAERAAVVARAERRALGAGLDQQRDLAAALVHRRHERDDALRGIEARPIRQRSGVRDIERRIVDLNAALEQIAEMTRLESSPGTAAVFAEPAGIQA